MSLLETTPGIRLQKYIADCGISSRRKAEELMTLGKVKVNGETVIELGTKINPEQDVVSVDGQIVSPARNDKIYLLLHKPRAYVTTVSDPEGRPTVMDLCAGISERIYPVGRLDYLSEGLLIMTNDGELAHKVMHPSFKIEKVYEVKVFGLVTPDILAKLKEGVQTEVGFLRPLSVRIVKRLPKKTWLEVRLGEGRNREIRRICEACGLTIDKLKRLAIGALNVEGIAPGKWRYLTKKEIEQGLGLAKFKNKAFIPDKYVSPKKSIKLKNIPSRKDQILKADDEVFIKYRKEHYQTTIVNTKKYDLLREERVKQGLPAKYDRKLDKEALNARKQRGQNKRSQDAARTSGRRPRNKT